MAQDVAYFDVLADRLWSVAQRGDGVFQMKKRRDDHAGVDSIGSSDLEFARTLGRGDLDFAAAESSRR